MIVVPHFTRADAQSALVINDPHLCDDGLITQDRPGLIEGPITQLDLG